MRTLPMFPLSAVLLPYESIPLFVFEPRYRVMVAQCMSEDRSFGVVLIERGSEVGGGDQRSDCGALATIDSLRQLPDGRLLLLVTGRERLEVRTWLEDDPFPNAVVEPTPGELSGGLAPRLDAATAQIRSVRELWSETYRQPLRVDEDPALDTAGEDERIWRLCSMTPLAEFDRYRLLRADDASARLALLETLVGEVRDDLELLRRQGGS